METFSLAKEFTPNPNFTKQRQKALDNIDYQDIDQPIVNIIMQINTLPFCFTLQCCFGHFLHADQQDEYNLDPIPKSNKINKIEYRIAYLAICIDGNKNGRELLNKLQELVNIDSQNIQFGGAEWFWERQVNTFVVQVEPERFKYFDKANLNYNEALHIEKIRYQFFINLEKIINNLLSIEKSQK